MFNMTFAPSITYLKLKEFTKHEVYESRPSDASINQEYQQKIHETQPKYAYNVG